MCCSNHMELIESVSEAERARLCRIKRNIKERIQRTLCRLPLDGNEASGSFGASNPNNAYARRADTESQP